MTPGTPGPSEPRDVLRALRASLGGWGPAVRLGEGRGRDVPTDAEPASDTAVVISTSGSTGLPKRVELSRSALTSSAMATAARIGEGSWLLALPAEYVAGVQVLVRSLVAGRDPALLSGSFHVDAFAAAALSMASYDEGRRVPTYTSLVPVQLAAVVTAAEGGHDRALAALRSFEAILVGGQALPAALADRAAASGARIVRTYGSSETSGGCVYDGVPLDGVDIRVEAGELQVAGPVLATGYLGDPVLTADRFVRDDADRRWYRTGDLGTATDGVVEVTGRADNVIISGGMNVSLDRVEAVVHRIPELVGSIVVGVADERWGEASVVVVGADAVRRHDEATLLADARALVATEVGRHARPAMLTVLPAVPRLANGKPDRLAAARLARERADGL